MKKDSIFNSILMIILILTYSQVSMAEISTDSYCQLSIQCLQQEASNFQELVALANQYQNDREALNQQ